MKNGWERDFLTIFGDYDGCGGFRFFMHYRQLILDVAFIENASKVPIKLNSLLGTDAADVHLRKLSRAPSQNTVKDLAPYSALTLAPGEKIAIPLRITFVASEDARKIFSNSALSHQVYQGIVSSPAKTVFSTKNVDGSNIRKTRDSFRAPSAPSFEDFVFGPAWELRGVSVNNHRVSLSETSRNYVEFTTVSNEGGSCPFLYVWDQKTQKWVWRGKVIHRANAKDKETTQEVELRSLSLKFQLREEELELSFIDRTFRIFEPAER